MSLGGECSWKVVFGKGVGCGIDFYPLPAKGRVYCNDEGFFFFLEQLVFIFRVNRNVVFDIPLYRQELLGKGNCELKWKA